MWTQLRGFLVCASIAVGLSASSSAMAHEKSCGSAGDNLAWVRVVTSAEYNVQMDPPGEKASDGGCYKVPAGKVTVKFLQNGLVKGTVGTQAAVNRTKVVRFEK